MISFASTTLLAQGINIDLGKTENGRYMNLVGNSGDSEITTTFIDPEYCAQNVGTKMYFAIDDNYMFQRDYGQFTIVNVEYYDAPDVEIKLIYDGLNGEESVYPLPIQTAGTNTWRSYNFFLDDCYFGNRMPNSADVGLLASNGTISINAVKIIPIDYYIDFNGTTSDGVDSPNNDEYFITQQEPQGGDSKTKYVTVEGEECITPTMNSQYIYCAVDDAMIFEGSHPYLFVAVEYFDDDAQNSMGFQYDGADNRFTNAPRVSGKAWGSFRTHTFEISDAHFGNNENGQSDFRVPTPKDMKINRITVGVVNTEPQPATSGLPNRGMYKALESPTVDGNFIDWEWLGSNGFYPDIDDETGEVEGEFYRTWLLDNNNIPVTEAGEPGATDPGMAGVWDTMDLSGNIRYLWDDENMYIALEVIDNVIDVDGSGWKEQDGLGFYIDVSHNYATAADGSTYGVPKRDDNSYQQGEHFIFLPATDSELGTWVHNGAEAGEALPSTVQKSYTVTDTGYVMEVSIPLDLLRDGITWTPGDDSQDDFDPLFQYVLNDADAVGPESGRLRWGGHSDDDEFWGTFNMDPIPLVDNGLIVDFGEENYERLITQTEKSGDGAIETVEAGGKKCAKLVNGYLYMDVEDAVIFDGNHKHLLFSIEYFDAGEGQFRLQYDAVDEPYKSTEWFPVGNTETWKTKIIEITDAKFANSENGGSDFRVHSDGSDLIVNQIRIGIADLWIDLGSEITGYGMGETKLGGGGFREVDSVGGVECKRNTKGYEEDASYLFHTIEDTLIFEGSHPEIFLCFEYYDTTSSGGIALNYDGEFTQWSNGEGNTYITGTNQWKLHTFFIDDAYFGNREHEGADFRIAGRGDGPTYINRIVIGALKPIATALDGEITANGFSLDHNYPNPFNPSTTIQYSVGKTMNVSMKVYNLNGQLVRTLVSESHTPGTYQTRWNGRDAKGRMVPSGLYIYRYTAGKYIKSYKMMLVK